MTQTDSAVFFLSDYGTSDEFVGVVHAVLHRLAPDVPVIDLSHQVAPFDVAGGAGMLVRCAPHLGAGVTLAVVDPGVGTDRRAVAIRTEAEQVGLDGPAWLVGPDNGLLLPMAMACGGIRSAVALVRGAGPFGASDRSDRSGPRRPGPTFDGRDVFAPAAAALALGVDPALLGTTIDPASLVAAAGAGPGPRAEPTPGGPAVVTSVVSIDRFGNVQLEAGAGALEDLGLSPGDTLRVTVLDSRADEPGDPAGGPDRSRRARRVAAFAQLREGELGVLVDSSGHLALVLDRASAADRLHPLAVGSGVSLAPELIPPDETSATSGS